MPSIRYITDSSLAGVQISLCCRRMNGGGGEMNAIWGWKEKWYGQEYDIYRRVQNAALASAKNLYRNILYIVWKSFLTAIKVLMSVKRLQIHYISKVSISDQ